MSGSELPRTISLPSAVFIIIGYVVGASIFILPGSMAADIGPAVFLAYGLAAIPAIVAGLVMAQIGSAFPVSGANFVLIRDALSPIAGFLYVWIMISMAAVVIPLVALGFADYFGHFLVGFDSRILASLIIVLFVVLNGFGVGVAAKAQNLMVIMFLAALLIFAIGGVAAGDVELLQPLFPKGISPLAIAATTAFFSYAGVFVIVEIAGEIKQPGKNIPRAIAVSFVVIIFLYMSVPLALNMIIPWDRLADTEMAVVTASQLFLPKPVVTIIAISALLAAATSINGIMLGLSRDVFQGAKSGLFPALFARVQRRTLVPFGAVCLVGVLALAGTWVGGTIVAYAQLSLIGIMVVQIMTGIALLRLQKVMPEVYQNSRFKLGKRGLLAVGITYIAFSVGFLGLLAAADPRLLLAGLLFLLTGLVYYYFWTRRINE